MLFQIIIFVSNLKGHLVGFEEKQGKEMIHNNINYGLANHEKLGADFLRNLNVAESVCCIVEGHVQAKRYLVFKVLALN